MDNAHMYATLDTHTHMYTQHAATGTCGFGCACYQCNAQQRDGLAAADIVARLVAVKASEPCKLASVLPAMLLAVA